MGRDFWKTTGASVRLWMGLEPDGEDGDVGGGDAADPGGLAEVGGADAIQLFAGLVAQRGQRKIVHGLGKFLAGNLFGFFDLPPLPLDVSFVAQFKLDLLDGQG